LIFGLRPIVNSRTLQSEGQQCVVQPTFRFFRAATAPRPLAVAHSRHLQGELKTIAPTLERPGIEKTLAHLKLEPQQPAKTPARGPVPRHAG